MSLTSKFSHQPFPSQCLDADPQNHPCLPTGPMTTPTDPPHLTAQMATTLQGPLCRVQPAITLRGPHSQATASTALHANLSQTQPATTPPGPPCPPIQTVTTQTTTATVPASAIQTIATSAIQMTATTILLTVSATYLSPTELDAHIAAASSHAARIFVATAMQTHVARDVRWKRNASVWTVLLM
jgi:hypothetical protein